MLEGSLCEGEANTENQNRKLGVGMPVWERQSQDDQSSGQTPLHSEFVANLGYTVPLSENKIKTDRALQPFSPATTLVL